MSRLAILMLSTALLLPIRGIAEEAPSPLCYEADDGALVCNREGKEILKQGMLLLQEQRDVLLIENLTLSRKLQEAEFNAKNTKQAEVKPVPAPDMTPFIVGSGVVGVLVGLLVGLFIGGAIP